MHPTLDQLLDPALVAAVRQDLASIGITTATEKQINDPLQHFGLGMRIRNSIHARTRGVFTTRFLDDHWRTFAMRVFEQYTHREGGPQYGRGCADQAGADAGVASPERPRDGGLAGCAPAPGQLPGGSGCDSARAGAGSLQGMLPRSSSRSGGATAASPEISSDGDIVNAAP